MGERDKRIWLEIDWHGFKYEYLLSVTLKIKGVQLLNQRY